MKIGTQDFTGGYVGTEEIKKIALGEDIVWEQSGPTPPAPTGYTSQYLTFDIKTGGTINWLVTGTTPATIEYSLNNGVWTSVTAASPAATINVQAGDKVRFKGENDTYGNAANAFNGFSGSSAGFEVYGNIMSLLYGDNFSGQTINTSAHTFSSLFRGCIGLTSAENLILPATALTNYDYEYMFYGCTSLTVAPVLPATSLSDYCYRYMFYQTDIVTAPVLSVTTLRPRCYYHMFENCTSLTTAPALPATTLANYCYQAMFQGCTSLVTAPTLPATTLSLQSYTYMFKGCTSLTTAPELPATTLANECYSGMFYGCRSLNYIKCLATDISASNCCGGWVYGVASSGIFVKNPTMNDWGRGTGGVPTNWTILDNPTHTTGVWLKVGSTEIEGVLSDGTYNFTPTETEGIEDEASLVIDGQYVAVNGNACGFYNVCEGGVQDSEGGIDPNTGDLNRCSEVETGVYKVGHAFPIVSAEYDPSTSALTLETNYQEECPEPEPEPEEPEEEPEE